MTSDEATQILRCDDAFLDMWSDHLTKDMAHYRNVCRLKWSDGKLNQDYRNTVKLARKIVALDIQVLNKEN